MPYTLKKSIGAMVRGRRQEAGLSQSETAEASGTNQPTISRLEAGEAEPSLGLLQRVAAALGCTVALELRPVKFKEVLWCVQHREGWCAIRPGSALDPAAMKDATACGHVVTLRTGSELRVPTCDACRRSIMKKGTSKAKGGAR